MKKAVLILTQAGFDYINDLDQKTLNQRVAEFLGDSGFFPSENCQSGHPVWEDAWVDKHYFIGELCWECTDNASSNLSEQDKLLFDQECDHHKNDRSWHPEWRVWRGEPKHFSEIDSVALSALPSIINNDLSVSLKVADNGEYVVSLISDDGVATFSGNTIALAISRAIVAASDIIIARLAEDKADEQIIDSRSDGNLLSGKKLTDGLAQRLKDVLLN